MNMGINLAARELRRALTGDINRSELPHCVVRAELQALLHEVEQQEEEQIKAERQEFEAALAEESKFSSPDDGADEPDGMRGESAAEPGAAEAAEAADWMNGEGAAEPDGMRDAEPGGEAGQEARNGT